MSEGPNTPPPGQQPDPPAQGQPPAGGPPPGQQPPPAAAPPPGQAPQAPQAPQQPAVGVGQPADLTTRFLAKLIDWIVLWVVNAVIVVGIIMTAVFSAGVGGMGGFGFGFSGWGLVTSVISAALYIAYFAFLESSRGQTLGKMLLKIQAQGPDGSNPTMEQAIKRNAWIALSIIPFIGWLAQLAIMIYIAITINNNTATRQGWHDEFAGGTKVIKIG